MKVTLSSALSNKEYILLNTCFTLKYVFDCTSVTLQSGGKEKGGNEKKKKKGEPEQELKKNPPTYTTLASWHVPLSDFLEGEFEYQSVFTQGGVEVASTVRSMDTESARKVRVPAGNWIRNLFLSFYFWFLLTYIGMQLYLNNLTPRKS